MIQPLESLLRQHKEYRVYFSDNVVSTGLFFADDTTLLSTLFQRHLAIEVDQMRMKPNLTLRVVTTTE